MGWGRVRGWGFGSSCFVKVKIKRMELRGMDGF
jgi:hypothetical protein